MTNSFYNLDFPRWENIIHYIYAAAFNENQTSRRDSPTMENNIYIHTHIDRLVLRCKQINIISFLFCLTNK